MNPWGCRVAYRGHGDNTLAGINVRRTIMLAFALMGSLAAVSAAVQTARLDAAVTNLGVQNELDVISAAVIGTSLAPKSTVFLVNCWMPAPEPTG